MGVSLYKRSSGGEEVYWYNIRAKNRREQRSTGIKANAKTITLDDSRQTAKQRAWDIANLRYAELNDERYGKKKAVPVPLFSNAMSDFLAWSRAEHSAKPATHKRHETSSRALLRHFGYKRLTDVGIPDVERFKILRSQESATRRGKGERVNTGRIVKPATVNRELALIRLVFQHASKSGVQVENPIRKGGVKVYKEDNEQTRVVTYEEQIRYLAVATPLLRDVATILLETGMRPEEVYRIERRNVDLEASRLFIPYGKTAAARRWVNLTGLANEVLKARMHTFAGQYLFSHSTDSNRPTPKVNNAHDRAIKAAGIAHFTIYSMRHTWATRSVQAGVDLVTLAAMLGHSKINMVLRYAHPTEEHQRNAMTKVAEYVAARKIEAADRSISQILALAK